jgi:Mg2+ and Co2+ transporter CorA
VQGRGGHVHFVELDQFVGPNWVLTVHGPMNVAVELDAAYVETSKVARRLDKGTLRPAKACDLSGALVNAVADRMRDYLTALTQDVWHLERQVTAGHVGDTETFLEELFGVRHGLLAVQTMAVSSKEVYGRMMHRAVFGAAGAAGLVDLEDQFRRIAAMADGEREYLQGVIEYYRTRTGTKMAIAAERLAVIAAVTLPVTALSSVMGMNVIVNDHTRTGPLALLLAVMLAMCVVLLIWTRRKGWW